MEKSFGLQFFLRKSRTSKTEEVPIYLRLTIDGERVEISIKRKCDPKKWNVPAGRVTGKNDDAKQLNAYLDTIQQKVFEAKRKHLELDKPITATAIKDTILGVEERTVQHMILEVFTKHNEQMKELIGKEYADGTWKRFKTSWEHTQRFLIHRYGLADIEVKKIDYEFVCEYGHWLKTVRNCGHNSAMKYLSNFKKIVIICSKNGWLTRDPLYFKI